MKIIRLLKLKIYQLSWKLSQFFAFQSQSHGVERKGTGQLKVVYRRPKHFAPINWISRSKIPCDAIHPNAKG